MVRACGTEVWMEYQVPLDAWEKKINNMTEGMTDLLAILPLIAEYRSGIYSIRDDDHRYEASRRKGWSHCQALVWHNTEEEWTLNPYKIKMAW
jgi:hypothetical protein